MVTFKGNNKMGVNGKGLIVVINDLSVIHINAFAFVVKDDIISFANVNRHLVGPEQDSGKKGMLYRPSNISYTALGLTIAKLKKNIFNI